MSQDKAKVLGILGRLGIKLGSDGGSDNDEYEPPQRSYPSYDDGGMNDDDGDYEPDEEQINYKRNYLKQLGVDFDDLDPRQSKSIDDDEEEEEEEYKPDISELSEGKKLYEKYKKLIKTESDNYDYDDKRRSQVDSRPLTKPDSNPNAKFEWKLNSKGVYKKNYYKWEPQKTYVRGPYKKKARPEPRSMYIPRKYTKSGKYTKQKDTKYRKETKIEQWDYGLIVRNEWVKDEDPDDQDQEMDDQDQEQKDQDDQEQEHDDQDQDQDDQDQDPDDQDQDQDDQDHSEQNEDDNEQDDQDQEHGDLDQSEKDDSSETVPSEPSEPQKED